MAPRVATSKDSCTDNRGKPLSMQLWSTQKGFADSLRKSMKREVTEVELSPWSTLNTFHSLYQLALNDLVARSHSPQLGKAFLGGCLP